MEILFDRTRNSDHVASYLKVFDDGRLITLALHIYIYRSINFLIDISMISFLANHNLQVLASIPYCAGWFM